MSARQNKKRGKGRNNANNRERTVTTLTEDPNTPYLVPTPSEEPASSPVLSTSFAVTPSNGNPNSVPAESAYQSSGNYNNFGYSSFNNGSMHGQNHPSSQLTPQQQQQFYPAAEQEQVILPPGNNDLEILENLKQIIKNGQHEMYRPDPQPVHLASLYLGPATSQRPGFYQQDPGYAEYSNSRGSYDESVNGSTNNGLAENNALEPPSPVESSRRPPRVQPKDSWDRSKAISEHSHELHTASSQHSLPQALSAISTSSAPSVSGPPSAGLTSTDAQTSDIPVRGGEVGPADTNGYQPPQASSAPPQNDASTRENSTSGDAADGRVPQADQVKSDVAPASVEDRPREVEYSRPPGPPGGNAGYSDRGYYSREGRYTDHRDYQDRRAPYNRFRDNRYTDVRRPPPEERHYEPNYDRPPRRYSDAEPGYHSRRLSDARPLPGHTGDTYRPAEGHATGPPPPAYSRPADDPGTRMSHPPEPRPVPVSQTQPPETKAVDVAMVEPASRPQPSLLPTQVAPAVTPSSVPPPTQKLTEPSQNPPITHTSTPQVPSEDNPANPVPLQDRLDQASSFQPSQLPPGVPEPHRSNPPTRQNTLDDRPGPPPGPGRYTRPGSPEAAERATYPPRPVSSARPGPPNRDDRTYRGPGPAKPPPPRDFRSRDQSRERQPDYRGPTASAYRPPERSYDNRRSDAMDVDSHLPPTPRFTGDRPFRRYSPERTRPPPPAPGPAPASDPPYEDRFAAGGDPYPPPFDDRRRDYRDDHYRPRDTWERPAGGPPPASAGATDRPRYDSRLPPPPPPGSRPYGWEARDDRDRRDNFPPRSGSPPHRPYGGGGPPRTTGARPGPYDSNAVPPSPTASYARVRQRSMSPPRRPSMDDARPPLKRPREDDYGGDYYSGVPPPQRPPRDYPPRPVSPPPASGGGSGYYDRAPPPPASASTTASGGPPPDRAYPPRDFSGPPYDRPRSPPGRGYTRPGGYGGRDDRYPPPRLPASSMPPPPRRP